MRKNRCNLGRGEIHTFEKIWRRLDGYYAFFGIRGVNWDQQYLYALKELGCNPSRRQLLRVLKTVLSRLEDGHVRLNGTNLVSYGQDPTKKTLRRLDQILSRHCSLFRFAEGLISGGMISRDESIAYLRVDSMESPVNRRQISAAMRRIKTAKGLILDLRFNGGGFDEVALHLMGHFIDRKLFSHSWQRKTPHGWTPESNVHLMTKRPQLLIPVVLLCGPPTASAAEIAVFAGHAIAASSRSQPMLTMGGRTEGITSDMYGFTVDDITISYSSDVYRDFRGRIFEKVGVMPMRPSPYDRLAKNKTIALRRRNFFSYLSKSFKTGTDPDVVRALSWLRGKVK
jgi:carboxyl-terminal processing protease